MRFPVFFLKKTKNKKILTAGIARPKTAAAARPTETAAGPARTTYVAAKTTTAGSAKTAVGPPNSAAGPANPAVDAPQPVVSLPGTIVDGERLTLLGVVKKSWEPRVGFGYNGSFNGAAASSSSSPSVNPSVDRPNSSSTVSYNSSNLPYNPVNPPHLFSNLPCTNNGDPESFFFGFFFQIPLVKTHVTGGIFAFYRRFLRR